MASPQVTLQALGLNYSPNALTLPPGSLTRADNIIIRRDNVVESRRGFLDYSETFGNSEDYAKQLIQYKDRIILHYSNRLSFDTAELDNDGKAIFDNFSGFYSETQTGLRIKSIEANKNLYFTTAEGIKKISAKSADDFTTDGVYTFKVSAANATIGAIYTNNGVKFTVTTTISGETILRTTGFSNPDSFGILTKLSGLGDATISYTSYSLTSKFIRNAGVIKALDITGRLDVLQGSSGFLPNDSAVAYRAVWGYKDANDNLLLGVPSNRIEIYNYMTDTISLDLNTLCLQLDSIDQGSCLIDDGNYSSSYYSPLNSSADTLLNNVKELAKQIDQDLLYANNTGTGVPLQMNTVQIDTGNVGKVIFNSDPTSYFEIGDQIELTGFTSEPSTTTLTITNVGISNPTTLAFSGTSSVSNGQSVEITGTNTSASLNGTHIATVTTSPNSISTSDITIPTNPEITCNNHGLSNGEYIRISGSNSTPSIDGYWLVSAATTNTFKITVPVALTVGPTIGTITKTTVPVNVSTVTTGTGNASFTTGNNLKLFNNKFEIISVNPSTVLPSENSITFLIPSDTALKTYTATAVDSGSKLNSYKYRYITATGDSTYASPLDDIELSVPATAEQIGNIYNTLFRISERLKLEKSGTIPQNLLESYITPFSMTFSANTKIKITIPPDISDDYFVQIYRSGVVTATGVTTLGNLGGISVIPNDELNLVSEIFPTIKDLENGYIILDDISPVELVSANTNLYTNPQSGVGIAGANEPPPFAKDINRFKDVTFYANTRTRQRLTPFQLLGVENIQENDKITICNKNNSETFTFIQGKTEITDIICNLGSSVSSGEYFNLYSQSGIYYAPYYIVDNSGTAPTVPNDAFGNVANLIRIDILSTDSKLKVAQKTLNKLNTFIYDFSCYNQTAIQLITAGTPQTTIQTEDDHNLVAGDTVTISGVSSTGTDLNATFLVFSTPTTNTFTISTAILPVVSSYENATVEINTITITAANEGKCLAASDFDTGFSIIQIQAGDGEDADSGQILLSSLISAAQAISQTSQSFVRVINKKSSIVNAYYISNENTAPGKINIEERGLSLDPFYISSNSEGTGISFNPDISPLTIINTDPSPCIIGTGNIFKLTSPSHGLNNGDTVVICGSNCDPIIDGYYSVIDCTTNSFSIEFSEPFISNGTKFTYTPTEFSVYSQAEIKPNRIYFSKPKEPEAVPLLNFYDFSAEDKEILRIFPLRDTLFVFKQDGTFRLSGELAPFVQSLLDSSCIVIAPDSVAATNNTLYAWTSKGISPISETGAGSEVSRPIDTEILRLSSAPFVNFSKVTWAVGYDSDSSYTVYTNYNTNDERATIGFRYCTLTNTWTNITRSQTCGINFSEQDVLYMGSGDYNIINKERKNFNRTDYADKDFSVELLPFNLNPFAKTIILPSVDGINVGDVLTQEQTVTIYEFNSLLQQLDIDPSVGTRQILGPSSGSSNTITITTTAPHFLLNNDYVKLSGTNSYPSLDGVYKITYVNSTSFTIQISNPLLTQTTVGIVKRNYEKTLSASSGDNIRTKLVQLASYLDTDPGIVFTDYSNRIASKSGEILANTEASPTIITTNTSHELINGRVIDIFETIPSISQSPESIPSIIGTYQVSNTGTFGTSNSFSIPENVTTSGGAGLSYLTANLNDFDDVQACYNEIITRLNEDTGTTFTTYKKITKKTLFEAIVTHINKASNKLTLNLSLQWLEGPLRVYNSINCELTYAPITFGDPLMQKQIFDATMMFNDKAITKITAAFSSDLKPEYTEINMYGQGNGIFGHYSDPGFGYGFFGGGSNAAPFRTLIPSQNQRCRFLNMKISHNTARESWALYGTTLTGNIGISTRAYR